MGVLMVGTNHRTASVELRERLAVGDAQLPAALAELVERFEGCEVAIVSTCNRTEYYIARQMHASPNADELRDYIAQHAGGDQATIDAALVVREQDQAIEHLFQVASGLDAMVLGETQVLGQVRRAYDAAQRAGTAGRVLHLVFQQAMATAKHLHTTTDIGAGRQSVGSVGVDFIRQVFETLHDKTLVCVGAGEVGKVVVQHALGLSPGRVLLTTRNAERSAALAQRLGVSGGAGGPRPWEALDDLLIEADVLIAATGATQPILTAQRVKPLLRKRRGRPLFMLDAALPRDIDPAVGGLSNVYLYNLDDLQPVVERTLAARQGELDRCRAQVRGAASMCMQQVQHQDIGRLIRALRTRLHGLADAERDRTVRKLAGCVGESHGERIETLLDEHTRRVINKVLHLPLSQLDDKNPEAPLGFYAAALRRLFDLDGEGEHPPAQAAKADDRAPDADNAPHPPSATSQSPEPRA